MTGHLVFATLHTKDAASAVERLVDLGLDRADIASCLRGIVAQRLLRRICSGCSDAYDGLPTPEEEADRCLQENAEEACGGLPRARDAEDATRSGQRSPAGLTRRILCRWGAGTRL